LASQDDLARIFGFKDRQTVSAIETGERRVSAGELLLAVEKLGASLDVGALAFGASADAAAGRRQLRGRLRLRPLCRECGHCVMMLGAADPPAAPSPGPAQFATKKTSLARIGKRLPLREIFNGDCSTGFQLV
jgi:transcriptional regulator with XRE-family HTH domain